MLGFLIFFVPFIEIYLLYKVGSRVGAVNVLFALLASFVLGLGIAKAQGRYIVSKMKSALGQNSLPTNEVMHGLVIFIAGVLFAIPGFLSDIVAFFLLLPGTRHLVVRSLRRRFARQVQTGGFKAFSFGSFGAFGGGFSTGRGQGPAPMSDDGGDWAREVTPKVIDVAPLSSRTVEKPKPTEN